jgi:hypothetical protein
MKIQLKRASVEKGFCTPLLTAGIICEYTTLYSYSVISTEPVVRKFGGEAFYAGKRFT